MTTVYVVDLRVPTRKIRACEASISTKKFSWAIELFNQKRHLIGSSAFFTLAAAERARVGCLVKIVSNSYTKHVRYDAWVRAVAVLEQIRKSEKRSVCQNT